MSKAEADTEGRVPSECPELTIDARRPRKTRAARRRHVQNVTVYYRLRCKALEAHAVSLTAELDRKETQLQEIIARYEEILQRRPDSDTVVTTPDV
jgi:hypothetical protein